MVEKLDKFIDRDVPANIIVQYYLYSIPDIIKLILPVAMMIASLFSVGQLARRNEITAMKASGQRPARIFLPIILFSFFVSVAALFWNDTAVPYSSRKKYNIDRVYLKKIPAQHLLKRRIAHDIAICSQTLSAVNPSNELNNGFTHWRD